MAEYYFLINKGAIVKGPIKKKSLRHKTISFGDNTTDSEYKAAGFLPQVRVGEDTPFNPNTHKKTGPVHTVGADSVTSTWTVVALSSEELKSEADFKDRKSVMDAMVTLGEIVITHIDAHLAKGNISASDFDAITRTKYQDLKIVIDRMKARDAT